MDDTKKPLSAMGAAALLHGWLAFRIKLDYEQVEACVAALAELIDGAAHRADMLGWLDEDAPDTERNS